MDLDPAMLAAARRKGPGIEWIEVDLAAMTVADGEGRPRADRGWLPARPPALALADYDRMAAEAGLALEHRWSTRDRRPYTGGGYTVSTWII